MYRKPPINITTASHCSVLSLPPTAVDPLATHSDGLAPHISLQGTNKPPKNARLLFFAGQPCRNTNICQYQFCSSLPFIIGSIQEARFALRSTMLSYSCCLFITKLTSLEYLFSCVQTSRFYRRRLLEEAGESWRVVRELIAACISVNFFLCSVKLRNYAYCLNDWQKMNLISLSTISSAKTTSSYRKGVLMLRLRKSLSQNYNGHSFVSQAYKCCRVVSNRGLTKVDESFLIKDLNYQFMRVVSI